MIENYSDIQRAGNRISVQDIKEGCVPPLVRDASLKAIVVCNYGEGRSKGVVEDLVGMGIDKIAYLEGGLSKIREDDESHILIANLMLIPNRLAILTSGEIRYHLQLIQMLQPSIHKDMASAYSHLRERM
ncbi:MAG: hypothetical protein AAB550_02525 [Patescibacteria group bacterium]